MSEPIPLDQAIREKLESTVGPVTYADLADHLERDGAFVVAPSLSLIECGVAVAMDDVARVETWIGSGELRKPTAEERKLWPTLAQRQWMAIIVRPFVLLQDLPD